MREGVVKPLQVKDVGENVQTSRRLDTGSCLCPTRTSAMNSENRQEQTKEKETYTELWQREMKRISV